MRRLHPHCVNHPPRYAGYLTGALLCLFTVLVYGEMEVAPSPPLTPIEECDVTPEDTHLWVDITHEYISETLCEPVAHFDNFFSTERALDDGHPGTYARWRNDFVWQESEGIKLNSALNASIRVPKATRRLKFIITDERNDNLDTLNQTLSLQDKNGAAPVGQAEPKASESTIGLRYDLLNKPESKFSLRLGVRTHIPLQLHTRARYKYTKPFNERYLFRFTENLYWKEWEGYGETTQLDLERLLNPTTLLRWSSSATFSELSRGVDWGVSNGIFHKLTAKTGVSLDLYVNGHTRPNTLVDGYGIVTSFRHNVYRSWFFYEVIPELFWPRDDEGHYSPTTRITLRFDIQFWQN